MFLAFGWVVIQSSQESYVGIDPASEQADRLDDIVNEKDGRLIKEMELWRILDGKITKKTDEFFTPFKSPHAFGGTNYWVDK